MLTAPHHNLDQERGAIEAELQQQHALPQLRAERLPVHSGRQSTVPKLTWTLQPLQLCEILPNLAALQMTLTLCSYSYLSVYAADVFEAHNSQASGSATLNKRSASVQLCSRLHPDRTTQRVDVDVAVNSLSWCAAAA